MPADMVGILGGLFLVVVLAEFCVVIWNTIWEWF